MTLFNLFGMFSKDGWVGSGILSLQKRGEGDKKKLCTLSSFLVLANAFPLFAAAVTVKGFLGNGELVNLWGNIGQNLLCLLVECKLGSNQISQVAKRLRLVARINKVRG